MTNTIAVPTRRGLLVRNVLLIVAAICIAHVVLSAATGRDVTVPHLLTETGLISLAFWFHEFLINPDRADAR